MEAKRPWQALTLFQRIILLSLAAMLIFFGGLTAWRHTRPGVFYDGRSTSDRFLTLSEEGGVRRYTGAVDAQSAEFIVDGDQVTYRSGDRTYGPYQVLRDDSVLPADSDGIISRVGVRVLRGEETVFEGGCIYPSDSINGSWYEDLVWSDGTPYDTSLGFGFVSTTSGFIFDNEGDEEEFYAPRLTAVIVLALGPTLSCRGSWGLYILAAVLSVAVAAYTLYYQQLLRWQLRWYVRDWANAEPSDWMMFGALIGILVLTGMVLMLYVTGAGEIASI